MKKIFAIIPTLVIVLIGSAIFFSRQKSIGDAELPIDVLLQEAQVDGYKVDGSQEDFYRLYVSNTSTRNNVYELISAAKERINQAIALQNLTQTTTTDEILGAIELTEAQKIFLEEYSKLNI